MQARTDAQLKRGIGEFYDESSGIWEEVWGEHMHHGYYREGEKPASFARHVEAQDDMIEKALELCGAADAPGGLFWDTQSGPWKGSIHDMNGDGHLDLVACHAGDVLCYERVDEELALHGQRDQ